MVYDIWYVVHGKKYMLYRLVENSVILHGLALLCVVFLGISMYSIVLHHIAWFCILLHSIAWNCLFDCVLHHISLECQALGASSQSVYLVLVFFDAHWH